MITSGLARAIEDATRAIGHFDADEQTCVGSPCMIAQPVSPSSATVSIVSGRAAGIVVAPTAAATAPAGIAAWQTKTEAKAAPVLGAARRALIGSSRSCWVPAWTTETLSAGGQPDSVSVSGCRRDRRAEMIAVAALR